MIWEKHRKCISEKLRKPQTSYGILALSAFKGQLLWDALPSQLMQVPELLVGSNFSLLSFILSLPSLPDHL